MLHGLDLLRKQYIKYAATTGQGHTPEETIKALAQKLEDPAGAREDRRAALLSLKSLVRNHADFVSMHALVPLVRWIQVGEKDEDMLRTAVECCLALCQVPEDAAGRARALDNMARLLSEKDSLLSLISLLSPEHSFYTRFGALQWLVCIVEHRRAEVQEYVLTAPGGCSAVLQCLEAAPSSSTEIIRNEALLLLPQLVKDSVDIQKIVAFEGVFERLLDIVAQEGRIEGGVVVQDALEGLETLLRHNVSNQNYFRETLSIPLLAPLLFYPPPLAPQASEAAAHERTQHVQAFLLQEWDEQKLNNARILMRCIGHLVDGQGEGHRANQWAMCKGGLVEALVQLALASLAPAALKAQALHVLASLLHGSRPVQDLLSTMVVTPVALIQHPAPAEGQPPMELSWQSPQPAMLCLIALVLRGPGGTSDDQLPLAVRCAALHAFEALVEQNMDVRMTLWHAFVAAPLPEQTHGNASQILLESVVHLPTTSLVSHAKTSAFDPYRYLFASTLLSYLLQGSDTSKEFARRVRLNDEGRCVADATVPSMDDDEPATLIHVVVGNLAMALREHGETVRRERAAQTGLTNSSEDWTKIIVGYLVLLSVWLWHSSSSIQDFVSESANLQVLVQPAAQSTGVDPLIQGLSAFVLGIAYEFHAATEGDVPEGVLTRQTMHPILHTRIGADQFSTRILCVKSDPRFASCTPEVLESVLTDVQPSLWFTWPFVEFWKDNYVRVQKSILVDPNTSSASEAEVPAELLDARQRILLLQTELARVQAEASLVEGLRADLAKAQEGVALADQERQTAYEAHEATKKELEAAHASHAAAQKELDARYATAQAELQHVHEDLQSTKAQLDAALCEAQQAHSAPAPVEDAVTVRALEATREELATAQTQVAHLEEAIQGKVELIQTLEAQLAAADRATQEARQAAEAAQAAPPASAPTQTTTSDDTLAEQLSSLQTENEDLLVLLDDIMEKRKKEKARMRQAGWEVSDDDSDGDEEEGII
ncbi:type I protein arginine methyltransferase [Malassezia equina]|uniref:Type I protein arginine methyltransferase n=1 Tax=Malassezia equina TaxID=1381935 RepID=A0AAF0EHR7_9BASI|nr:type I protein arginine methyltransferase [Malassezia equina]